MRACACVCVYVRVGARMPRLTSSSLLAVGHAGSPSQKGQRWPCCRGCTWGSVPCRAEHRSELLTAQAVMTLPRYLPGCAQSAGTDDVSLLPARSMVLISARLPSADQTPGKDPARADALVIPSKRGCHLHLQSVCAQDDMLVCIHRHTIAMSHLRQ